MSAAISCLTANRPAFFAASSHSGPALLFSTLMRDEAKAIARGLQRRDPNLLDRLIEQYQYRLFRYLVYITGNKERAEDFFQETWLHHWKQRTRRRFFPGNLDPRSRARPPVRRQVQI